MKDKTYTNEELAKMGIFIIKNSTMSWEECVKETLADSIVFRKGKNYDLLREGLKKLD